MSVDACVCARVCEHMFVCACVCVFFASILICLSKMYTGYLYLLDEPSYDPAVLGHFDWDTYGHFGSARVIGRCFTLCSVHCGFPVSLTGFSSWLLMAGD